MGMSARDRISKLIIDMLDKCPFYAELMMRSSIRVMSPEEESVSPTMAVNMSGELVYCERFVDGLTDEELAFVLLHETQHKVFLHLLRCGSKNPIGWNIAADIVVDNTIVRQSWNGLRVKVPKGRIIAQNDNIRVPFGPDKFLEIEGISSLSTEQVYERVMSMLPPDFGRGRNKKKGDGGGDGKSSSSGALGKDIDEHDYSGRESLSESELREREESLKQEIVEAAFRAKKRGHLPAHVERMLKVIMEGKVDWRQYLYRYVLSEMPYDYTLTRPNRRYVSQGLYVPGVVKEKLDVVVAIDLSGSIGDDKAKEFLGEVSSLIRSHPNASAKVICHDTEVTSVAEVNSWSGGDVSVVELKGGGGTDHHCVFKWVDENCPNARVVVCLTDGYSRFPSADDVHRDVIWVTTGRYRGDEFRPPFGLAVSMDERGEV